MNADRRRGPIRRDQAALKTQDRLKIVIVPPYRYVLDNYKYEIIITCFSGMIAIGLEGSANKLGIGIIEHVPGIPAKLLSNLRHTYVSPPGKGFLPKDTAKHHRSWIISLVLQAILISGVSLRNIDCICYTKVKCGLVARIRLLIVLKVLEWARLCSQLRLSAEYSRPCGGNP